MKYIYKALIQNTTQNKETKQRVMIWDPSILSNLSDGQISYNKFYHVC